jgi:cytochrome c peroxidase
MRITQRKDDAYKFKVPTLRNIEFSYPYMHDGRFKKLNEVLNHYASGIKKSETLDARLQNGIVLTSNQKVDLIAFLLTLSDKEFLFDAKFAYPKEVIHLQ